MRIKPSADLLVYKRLLSEVLKTGLSRPPAEFGSEAQTLSDFARVMRGVATGANEFFMTAKQAKTLQISSEFLIRAIGRTRDIKGDELTIDILEELNSKSRLTFIFSPDGRTTSEFLKPVRALERLSIPVYVLRE